MNCSTSRRNLTIALTFAAIAFQTYGCKKGGTSTTKSSISINLPDPAQDALSRRHHKERVLYSRDDIHLLLRELAENEPPAIVSDQSFAKIYVLSGNRQIGAIDVDLRQVPYQPTVLPLSDDGILLLSYQYFRQDEMNPVKYTLQVHHIKASSVKKVLNHPFISLGINAQGTSEMRWYAALSTLDSNLVLLEAVGDFSSIASTSGVLKRAFVWQPETNEFAAINAGK